MRLVSVLVLLPVLITRSTPVEAEDADISDYHWVEANDDGTSELKPQETGSVASAIQEPSKEDPQKEIETQDSIENVPATLKDDDLHSFRKGNLQSTDDGSWYVILAAVMSFFLWYFADFTRERD